MTNRHSTLYIARVVLEAKTPLSISTGTPDGVFDTALVRDANGLPALPGSSIAGVLRHLWQERHGAQSAKRLFGRQEGKNGEPSRVIVSWGALLDSRGRPVEGLLLGEEARRLKEDPLLRWALEQIDAPIFRNRVRLTHRGAAADTGKFDRAVLPAGNRFAFELRLWAAGDNSDDWPRLLALLTHPGFRLGGATRAGLGRVRAERIHQAAFDLRNPERVAAFCALGTGLADTAGLAECPIEEHHEGWVEGTLRLKARGLWRIGQGNITLNNKYGKPAELRPLTEERVAWQDDGCGKPALRALVLPASSLKGALAHRMAFHARRLQGYWAEETVPDGEPARPPAVTALLGEVKEKRNDDGEEKAGGRAGALFLDDAFLEITPDTVTRLMHNAIDRFTSGVRHRMLFDEESILGGELEIRIAINPKRLAPEHAELACRAFKDALDDLCQGRLALGSRTTTGNGFFHGEVEGPLRKWLDDGKRCRTEEAA